MFLPQIKVNAVATINLHAQAWAGWMQSFCSVRLHSYVQRNLDIASNMLSVVVVGFLLTLWLYHVYLQSQTGIRIHLADLPTCPQHVCKCAGFIFNADVVYNLHFVDKSDFS